MEKHKPKYDLEERTKEFGKRIIRLCKALPNNAINDRLIRQVVGSGDSVGANYAEANDALSKQDMLKGIRICRKEAKETKLHLELLVEANSTLAPRMQKLIQEARELVSIFSAIIKKLQKSKQDKDDNGADTD